jgi:hypothetical protein
MTEQAATTLQLVDVVGMTVCFTIILTGVIVTLVLCSSRIMDTLRMHFGTPIQKATARRNREIDNRAARIMLERCIPYEYNHYDGRDGAKAIAIRELQREYEAVERLLK